MRNRTKNIIFLSTSLIIGIGIGYVSATVLHGEILAKGMFMLEEKEIYEFAEAANEAYFNQPPIVGIWALENHIRTLERIKQERAVVKHEHPYFILSPDLDLKFAHARVAILHKKLANDKKYNHHINQALLLSGERTNEEKLLALIRRLDEKKKEKQ